VPVVRLSDPFPGRRELRPDQEVGSIAEIDAQALYDRGVRAIGFDADQTLCEFYGKGIDDSLLTNIEAMRGLFEDRLCIISNCTEERRLELVEKFPLHVVSVRTKKPDPEAYRSAEEHFAIPPEQWAFVGDRLLTDIVGANRAGWHSIHVRPLVPGTDPWFMPLARVYEGLLRRAYRV
jgi:HAD superfamily phosphatase (TIGR01668 family)